MSSSFTDQPSPRDPRHEEGYTPTPPAPEHGGEENDVESVRPRPKLGSLAQKARGKQLKQARIILFVIGLLLILGNSLDIALALPVQNDVVFLLVCAIDGAFIFNGVVFLVLGTLIYRFPVPATILSLGLFVLTWGLGVLIALAINPIAAASVAASGIILRIIVIVVLAKSIQSALAYERERREQADYETA